MRKSNAFFDTCKLNRLDLRNLFQLFFSFVSYKTIVLFDTARSIEFYSFVKGTLREDVNSRLINPTT
jgi:hypothetical protein